MLKAGFPRAKLAKVVIALREAYGPPWGQFRPGVTHMPKVHKWSAAQRAKFAATMRARQNKQLQSLTELSDWGKDIQREEIQRSFTVAPVTNSKVKARAGVTFQFAVGDQIVTARITSVNHKRPRLEDL